MRMTQKLHCSSSYVEYKDYRGMREADGRGDWRPGRDSDDGAATSPNPNESRRRGWCGSIEIAEGDQMT